MWLAVTGYLCLQLSWLLVIFPWPNCDTYFISYKGPSTISVAVMTKLFPLHLSQNSLGSTIPPHICLMCLISPRGTWGCSPGVSEICALGWWARQRDNPLTLHLCSGIRKAALSTWWWLWLCRCFSTGSACVRTFQPCSTNHMCTCPMLFLLIFGSCHCAVFVVVLVPLLTEPCDQTDQNWK